MKQCPQCRQTYSDDTLFCLSDGTPLVFINDLTEAATVFQPTQPTQEEITVVKPHREEITVVHSSEKSPPPVPIRQGVSPIFAYLAVGLLLLLVGGVAILAGIFIISQMSGGSSNTEVGRITNTDNGQSKINDQQANLRQQHEQIETERQRLANERRKIEEQKNKPLPPVNTSTPVSTPPPAASPPPAVNQPPQPTVRIKFGRGRVSESISGKIYSQRSFVLEARSGQFLSASVNGGSCVTFSNGGTSTGFSTVTGDNRLTLINKCGTEAAFSLTVSIR